MNGDGRRFLVPLDGSALSAWILDRGEGLFHAPGAIVTLMGVAPKGDDASAAAFRGQLEGARERLASRGVAARTVLRAGDPAEEILRELGEEAYAYAALSTHGRSGLARVLFGSVARRVLQDSRTPLLLFRPLQRADGTLSPVETREPARLRRILALLDGSCFAEEILAPAMDLARLLSAEIRLFSAVPGGPDAERHRAEAQSRLETWQRRLSLAGIRTSIEIRHGAAATEALGAARDGGADLLALTTHGRTGLALALYGSVAERLLADAPVPLLVRRSRIQPAAVEAGPAVDPAWFPA